ncbi:MAG TPA: T9SS type A sorting domain-containing protein [Candidatus Cloacimonadota bacterium]|nr:T9SS type A sorting domain-containing protein [Candidatus Cloacimonadota bacterium]HPT73134.1 T9SS type A sorting domain-containing protein [Candidatus Cloacimonadota bacterium]
MNETEFERKEWNMRYIIIIFSMFLSCFLYSAQWDWVKSAGAGNLDRVWDLAIDNQDNILLAGEFTDSLQIGDQVMTGWGLNDIFVAKLNSSGHLLWMKVFGGADGDIGLGIDVDNAGNSYVTGYYSGSAHFGETTLNSIGSWDVFIMKLDANGGLQWVRSEGGPTNDIGYGIAVTPDGTSITTGWFAGSMTFHDNTTMTGYGSSDILVLALNSEGDIVWKHQAGSSGIEYGYKVDTDYNGNSYITGVAGAGSDFDGLQITSGGMFIASYTSSGQIRWANSGLNAGVNSIAVDDSPSPIEQIGCVTGRMTGNVAFGNINLSSFNATDDAYNATFQLLNGEWVMASQAGADGSDKGRACAYRQYTCYAGSFEQSANIFGFPVTSAGGSDVYVLGKTNSAADWLLTGGGVNNEAITDIGVNSQGKVIVCGWFSGLASFSNDISVNSGNDYDLDMFVGEIDPSATGISDHVSSPVQINCYPNPFSKELNIDCLIKGDAPTQIHIFNVKGQKVWSQTIQPYERSLRWDGVSMSGTDCPSGIYFVQLDNGINQKSVKTIVKIK